jgi:hypothetical protein
MKYVRLRERFITERFLSLQLVKSLDGTLIKLSEFKYFDNNAICELVIKFFTKKKQERICTYEKNLTDLEIILVISGE